MMSTHCNTLQHTATHLQHSKVQGQINLPHTSGFLIQTMIKKRLENAPLSRNFVEAERKRPGLGGVMLTKGFERNHGNNICWVKLV